MKSLLKLKSYLRPHFWYIFISCLLAIPLAALRFSPAPMVKYFIDDLLIKKDTSYLYLFPVIVIAVFALNFVIRFVHYYLLRVVIARVNQKIKNDLSNHLVNLSADYYTEQSTGTLMSRVATDPNHIDGGISCINVLVREPITFFFFFGYALYLNWKLTLITLLIFPAVGWLFSSTGKHLKRYMTRMTQENAKIFSSLQETFTGIRIIKAFNLEQYVQRKYEDKVEDYTKLSLKTAAVQEASHPGVELLSAFAIAFVVFFGGREVLSGTMTGGDLTAFFTSFALMMNPVRMLNDVNIKLHQADAAVDRILEILSWKSNLRTPKHPEPIKKFQDEVLFDRVSFAYPDSPARKVLQEISFALPKGEALAVVGASGSGKSSLANLIPRIFDVIQGCISLDGKDIRDLDLKDLRNLVSVVSQDVFLFNDSIMENIRCGRLGASDEDVLIAARHAHALDFVTSLPQQFQTVIGDRGLKLSGGERQRISIARAFLKNAPILILDEATSSLDSVSEKVVQEALDELMKNKTTLLIAHRLSTVRNADRIIVLKDGRMIETGSHHELMDRGGEYAKFYHVLATENNP